MLYWQLPVQSVHILSYIIYILPNPKEAICIIYFYALQLAYNCSVIIYICSMPSKICYVDISVVVGINYYFVKLEF